MPTDQEAADILRQFFGFMPNQPYDPRTGTYAPGTPGIDAPLPPDHNPDHFTIEPPPSPPEPSPFSRRSQLDRMAPDVGGVNITLPTPLDANRLPEEGGTPKDTNSGRAALARMLGVDLTAPPDPREAADILARDPLRANDPQALARNRRNLQYELEDRIAADKFGAALPQEGFVPGEPGRRYVSRLPAANLAADEDQLARVRRDQAADPFTGAEETARVARTQAALDQAATTVRPELTDAAEAVANRNYFAEFMKNKGLKMGEYAAAASPEAYAAAMTPIRAAASAENQAVLDAAGRRLVDVAATKNTKGTKYTAPEQQLLDSANTVQELGPKLLALLQEEHPGIDADPTKFGSWTDKIGGEIGKFIYKQGKTKTARSDQIDQLVGYLEAQIPRMLVPGRVNQQQYEDLKLHGPALGFSDGANYERVKKMLTVILPDVLKGMDEAHGGDPTNPALGKSADAADKYAPPTPAELAAAGALDTNARADALLRRR
jgi:hypothetical protein